jgi:hypothetical protein
MACAIVAREAAKQRHSHRGTIFLALVLDAYSDDRVLPECCTNSSLQTSQSEDADQKNGTALSTRKGRNARARRQFEPPGRAKGRLLGNVGFCDGCCRTSGMPCGSITGLPERVDVEEIPALLPNNQAIELLHEHRAGWPTCAGTWRLRFLTDRQ